MELETWTTQLRKGAAELALLATLSQQPASGTTLVQRLSVAPALGLADGTVYPLLARLEREGRINGQWNVPEAGGRPTKSYSLTEAGAASLAAMTSKWRDFSRQLDAVLEAPQ